jgi:nitroreductase
MQTEASTQILANETLQTIYQRRAIRKYRHEAVDKVLIEQVIDAGRMAPSAINKQPWKFYVLTRKIDILSFSVEIEKVIEDTTNLAHRSESSTTENFVFHDAPVVIFITAPKDNEWAPLDIGMCAENIMLAAKSLGLDTCPVGLAKFVEKTKIYGKLNIPETEKVMLAVIMGYGDELAEPKERKRDNAVFIS